MLEDTNSLDGAQIVNYTQILCLFCLRFRQISLLGHSLYKIEIKTIFPDIILP